MKFNRATSEVFGIIERLAKTDEDQSLNAYDRLTKKVYDSLIVEELIGNENNLEEFLTKRFNEIKGEMK